MSEAKHVNVVLILTDDQGWGDLSRSGNSQIHTPHIDKLAADGATMDNFHVQPLCAPTRAEILTGRYFPWTGVRGVTRCAERLDLNETTMADCFKQAGYATGCFGKWHSGMQYPYHPNGRGFDEFYGYCCGHWSHYFDSTIEHNGVEVQAPGYLTDALTSKAIAFIQDHQDTPFFCYVPLNTPHSPFQVPDKWFDKFADAELPLRATFHEKENLMETRSALAMCENIDWNVGRIREALQASQLTENTVVVYLSDNGPNTWRYNGQMRGKKGGCEEGGVRSPCSITWPGQLADQQVIKRVAGAIDLLPTLAELTGIELSTNKPLDGKSLVPLLKGNDQDWPDRTIFAQKVWGYNQPFAETSVRSDRYRAYEDGSLFDLTMDIGETHDLAGELPEISNKYNAMLADWRKRLPDHRFDQALPVGYRDFPMTYLPVQDAQPGGEIRFSSVHPNCSWMTHWHRVDDQITWHIKVNSAGRYRATLMYACSAENVGSHLELSYGEESLSCQITEPFDSEPKTGFDRVPRQESYDRAFTPLEMGELDLISGEGTLTLRCTELAGKEVGDIRTLRLELLD